MPKVFAPRFQREPNFRHLGVGISVVRTVEGVPEKSRSPFFPLDEAPPAPSADFGKPIALAIGDWRNETVIRINRIREDSASCLIVEGTLSGEWVDELEKCWLDTGVSPNNGKVRVELSGVTYIDDKGRLLLESMFRQGAELSATRIMTRAIIEEITAEKQSPDRL